MDPRAALECVLLAATCICASGWKRERRRRQHAEQHRDAALAREADEIASRTRQHRYLQALEQAVRELMTTGE